ncbi:MAG TPA: pectate lyase [bacterium]|nr:pectate lyase [bacterium]
MRRALAIAILLLAVLPGRVQPAEIPLDGFAEGIKRWRDLHGEEDARYRPDQFEEIADNLLRYQRYSGGWRQNLDPTRILGGFEKLKVRLQKLLPGGSFDNENIFPQVRYLAAAYRRSGHSAYRDGSLRGLEFILAQQDPGCGGWPHTVPPRSRYESHLTIADGVMVHALSLLREVAAGAEPFDFIEPALRQRAAEAVVRGDACLLRLQVRQNGILSGWAGQYDMQSLAPAQGRAFEPPALDSRETVRILRYLMKLDPVSPEIAAAIEAGAGWLARVERKGWRLETFAAETQHYRFHTSHWDRRLVADPAGRLWARFYGLHDNRVLLATMEGKIVEDYAELPRERRTGYEWFGDWPRELLDSIKKGSASAP